MSKETASPLTDFEKEIALMIVESLNLEKRVEEIDPEQRLFNEGLGLDSIDALELSLSISQKYGLKIRSNDNNIEEIFSSLRALSHHIEKNRVT